MACIRFPSTKYVACRAGLCLQLLGFATMAYPHKISILSKIYKRDAKHIDGDKPE